MDGGYVEKDDEEGVDNVVDIVFTLTATESYILFLVAGII